MQLLGTLAHGLITLLATIAGLILFGSFAGGIVAIAWYWGREGAEAQYASGKNKTEMWWLPFVPVAWPLQMQLDLYVPINVVIIFGLVWTFL